MSFSSHQQLSSSASLAAVLFLLLLVASAFSNFTLHLLTVIPRGRLGTQFKLNCSTEAAPLFSLEEEKEVVGDLHHAHHDDNDDPDPLPPTDATAEDRIIWFRENLHRFKVLHSTASSRQFAMRARGFFGGSCDTQFFMTWISPARHFGSRELLSLESLFKAHPRGCLLILFRTLDSDHGGRALRTLSDAGFRVAVVAPDLPFLFRKTPAEAWFRALKKGGTDPGEIPLAQNLSNLIRLAVLYRYGGVYLDTDVIVLKNLSALKNSIGAQTLDLETRRWSRLNNPLLLRFIEEFALTFDGSKWGHNGPYLVSKVVERVELLREKLKGGTGALNYNFSVLPPMAFYPVGWNGIGGFFRRPESRAASRWVEAKLVQLSGGTYTVHLWNRRSGNLRIEEGSIIHKILSDRCILLCGQTYDARHVQTRRRSEHIYITPADSPIRPASTGPDLNSIFV